MNPYVGNAVKPVTCTGNSNERKHPGALTYVEDNSLVQRAYVDHNKEIKIETVMKLERQSIND